jgi:hypothetical protein
MLACFYAPTATRLLAQTSSAPLQQQIDTDRDGLTDAFEQQLLERFAPHFFIAAKDCAGQPAEFTPNSAQPVAGIKNGTIYGQAFPNTRALRNGAVIELQYFHLWDQDCGRISHKLDAERVSVLISADSPALPVEEWKALYWYSSAHQGTTCDATHGIRATLPRNTNAGADVWVSYGKHATYLDRALCGKGCGGDRCDSATLLAISRIINLGELKAPMNGAVWVDSPEWGIAEKMSGGFDESVVSKLAAAPGEAPVALNTRNRVVKRAARIGLSGMDAAASGADQAGHAAEAGDGHAGTAIRSASDSTGNAISRSIRATGGALRKALRFIWPGSKTEATSAP